MPIAASEFNPGPGLTPSSSRPRTHPVLALVPIPMTCSTSHAFRSPRQGIWEFHRGTGPAVRLGGEPLEHAALLREVERAVVVEEDGLVRHAIGKRQNADHPNLRIRGGVVRPWATGGGPRNDESIAATLPSLRDCERGNEGIADNGRGTEGIRDNSGGNEFGTHSEEINVED
jgi:hypothetical protein